MKVLPNTTEPLGVQVLKSRGFFTDAYWYWLGLGALAGFILLFNFGFTLALSFLNRLYPYHLQLSFPKVGNSDIIFAYICAAFGKNQAVISEESQSNEHDNRTGGTIQLSTSGRSSDKSHPSESSFESFLYVLI